MPTSQQQQIRQQHWDAHRQRKAAAAQAKAQQQTQQQQTQPAAAGANVSYSLVQPTKEDLMRAESLRKANSIDPSRGMPSGVQGSWRMPADVAAEIQRLTTPRRVANTMKKGGTVKKKAEPKKYAAGGCISAKKADGIASKGKTKCKMR